MVCFMNNYKSLSLILLVMFNCCTRKSKSGDIILIAPSYTMNIKQPWAESIVIKEDKIVFVGDKDKALLYKNNLTRIIEKPNGMILPGFIDAHVHLLWGGIEMSECSLHGLATKEQLFQAIQNYINANPDCEWIRGSGWELPIFPNGNPRKEWLDKISKNKPIFLLSADGHSAWVNSKALSLANINSQTPEPINGRIERDPISNDPSGILREDAMEMVEYFLPRYSKKQIDTGLEIAVKEANKLGITSILDAGTESYTSRDYLDSIYDGLDSYREATKDAQLSIRVSATQYARPKSWRKDLLQIKKRRFRNKFAVMNTIKIFADGVIEGGTAALIEPYEGTDNYGILNWNPDTLKNAVAKFEKEGFQIHIHAIGDRGIRISLDAFEYAKKKNNLGDTRHMITHAQLIHPNDISRFEELDVIANFQALWAYPDQYIKNLTLPVLGPVRSNWIYPLKSVIKSGGRITGGSDWTVSSMNPLHAIEVAITRRELGKQYGETLIPEEAVELENILRAYTLDGAFSIFNENAVGSLEIGKSADIIILNKNLFQIPSHEIHDTGVEITIFNGKVVYENH